jgi:hypothetical protein
MGADTRKSVTIVDVDKEGRVVRCNRLELIYASNEGTVETPLEQPGFFTRMPQYETSQSDTYGYPAQYGQVGPSDDRRPPVYRGQYPYDYRMAQEVRQWTPVVNRRFSFAPPADLDLLEVDWQAVEREALAYENRGEGGDTLLDTLGDDLPEGVEAHVLQWGTVPNWLEGLCRVESEGIHKLVSAVSPSGCWSYEDVPIPAQSSQTLVVVVEPREESYVVYRRLYGGEK